MQVNPPEKEDNQASRLAFLGAVLVNLCGVMLVSAIALASMRGNGRGR